MNGISKATAARIAELAELRAEKKALETKITVLQQTILESGFDGTVVVDESDDPVACSGHVRLSGGASRPPDDPDNAGALGAVV